MKKTVESLSFFLACCQDGTSFQPSNNIPSREGLLPTRQRSSCHCFWGYSYLYGRPFTIYSDHKPLMYLFGEHKGIPTMASARVLRWAVTLSAYQYSIRYKPGSEVCHADALSRLPIPSSNTDSIPGSIIGLIDFMSSTPLSSELVKKHTQRDPVLSRVCQFVLNL